MKLGSSIARQFVFLFGLGIVALLAFVIILVLNDSPYRADRPGIRWMFVQAASALVLIYSGMFGLMTCNATEESSRRFNMKVAWIAFGVIAVLFLGAIFMPMLDPFLVVKPGNGADTATMVLAVVSAVFAIFGYIQACRYFLRIHRLKRPYEEMMGE